VTFVVAGYFLVFSDIFLMLSPITAAMDVPVVVGTPSRV
jgi:hypothetical protein